ncbi:hypothetical protein Ciccas_009496 [Cichlidogyrus casuarinus]|uniref:Uncharacterized protein n=1 Tax=Cichlidogyrus casuarinus TaxID=1844966 RepID=A0ABD2PXK5_9PLAT
MLKDANELIKLAFSLGKQDSFVRQGQEKSQLSLLPSDSFADDNVNRQDSMKRTALHAAAFLNNYNLAEELIQNGARVTVKDINWLTPLHRACASNSFEVAKLLIENGADRTARDKQWQMPLHVAVANGSLECIKLLLSHSSNQGQQTIPGIVNATDRGGNSALHHAVFHGHVSVVSCLLDNGASLNAFDKRERRVMHWAAATNSPSLIELLVQKGAELECKDKTHFTPLHVASSLGHTKAVAKLLALGADFQTFTTQGNTPLHLACLNGHTEVLALLIEHVKKYKTMAQLLSLVNIKNSTGLTTFHLATSSTSGSACLQYLLDATSTDLVVSASFEEDGDASVVRHHCLADLNARDYRSHFTPLHMAAFYGRFERAQVLISYGANFELCDRFENTLLHIAASQGHDLFLQRMLHFLQESGARHLRWDTAGAFGATPLHLAAINGHPACLSRLIQAAVASETNKFTPNFMQNSPEPLGTETGKGSSSSPSSADEGLEAESSSSLSSSCYEQKKAKRGCII